MRATEAEESRNVPEDFSSPGVSSEPEWSPLSQPSTPANLRTLSFSHRNNAHRNNNRAVDLAQGDTLRDGTQREEGAFVIGEEMPGESFRVGQNNPSRGFNVQARRRSSFRESGDGYRQQVMPSYFVGGSPSFAIQGIQILTTPQRPAEESHIVTTVPCQGQVRASSSYYPAFRTLGNPYPSAELALQISPSPCARPSTSTFASATTSRGRKKAWWVVNCFTEVLDENLGKVYVCLACKAKKSGKQSASRLAEHIWKCSQVDDALKKRLFDESQHIRSIVRTYSGESQCVSGKRPGSAMKPKKRRRLNNGSRSLAGHCSEEEADEISMKLVRTVVVCCLPLTIFDSASIEGQCFRDTFFSARPEYRDMYPSRHSVMVKFLPRLYKRTYDVVKRSLKQMLSTGYGTIIFDGSDDITRSSVVNVLIRVESKSNRKVFFLDSVFTKYAKVGAFEYVKILERVMDGFGGMGKVCGVNARAVLAQKYPGLIGIQDQAHVADLLMKDIGKLHFFRDVLDKVNMIAVETKSKRKLLSFLREAVNRENSRLRMEMNREGGESEGADVELPSDPMHPARLFPPLRKTAVMLRKPSPTRFTSIGDTLEAFIRTRDVLYQVVGDRKFDRHLFAAEKPEQEERRELYKDLVRSVTFLDSVKEVHNVFRLCRRYLRIFDREKDTSIADVVPCTESLCETLAKVPTSSEYLTRERLELIQTDFKRRKDGPITGRGIQVRLIEDVHVAAYLLHPTKFPTDYQQYEQRFYSFVKRHVDSTMHWPSTQDEIGEEEDSSLTRERVYLTSKIMNDYDAIHSRWMVATSENASESPREGTKHVHYELAFRAMPLRFWIEESRVGTCPELCKLALRTLSISPSSCSAERTFSMQGRIRTKLRNRLDENVVRKMMFVKWNIKHYDEIMRNTSERQKQKNRRDSARASRWFNSEDESSQH